MLGAGRVGTLRPTGSVRETVLWLRVKWRERRLRAERRALPRRQALSGTPEGDALRQAVACGPWVGPSAPCPYLRAVEHQRDRLLRGRLRGAAGGLGAGRGREGVGGSA